jgi:tetratricopeptide (TPR) repeat protein
MVHAYAGNLLMTTGSYEDAAKAFTNADSVQPCAFAIYQRARCQLAIGDFKLTMSDLEKACSMFESRPTHSRTSQNCVALRDKLCLENILSSIELLDLSSTKYVSQSEDNEEEEDDQEESQKEEKGYAVIELKEIAEGTTTEMA